jgi:hypothetical protein
MPISPRGIVVPAANPPRRARCPGARVLVAGLLPLLLLLLPLLLLLLLPPLPLLLLLPLSASRHSPHRRRLCSLLRWDLQAAQSVVDSIFAWLNAGRSIFGVGTGLALAPT